MYVCHITFSSFQVSLFAHRFAMSRKLLLTSSYSSSTIKSMLSVVAAVLAPATRTRRLAPARLFSRPSIKRAPPIGPLVRLLIHSFWSVGPFVDPFVLVRWSILFKRARVQSTEGANRSTHARAFSSLSVIGGENDPKLSIKKARRESSNARWCEKKRRFPLPFLWLFGAGLSRR